MRSAIKAVPAANSDHVTARAVGPSPEATMMKRMYRLRKKQDTRLGSEATAVLTFEVNDEALQYEKHGDAVIETFWNIAGFKLQGW
jgi:hypothetical protein